MTYTDQEKPLSSHSTDRAGQSSNYVQNAASAHGLSTAGRRPSGSGRKRTYTVKEYDALLRRVAKLENMVAILQTVGLTVHAPLKERLGELELLYGQYDVHTLCEAI